MLLYLPQQLELRQRFMAMAIEPQLILVMSIRAYITVSRILAVTKFTAEK
jgi:hypothetical protein